jgi:hypothetical protein
MEIETWKDIKGYEGYYQVSNMGRIKGLERRVKKISINTGLPEEKVIKEAIRKQGYSGGYSAITLYKEGVGTNFLTHILVAKAFIPNPNNKPEVNHIQGNKKDNRACMLEWNTESENLLHSYRVLGRKLPKSAYIAGSEHKEAKPIIVTKKGEIKGVFTHSTEVAENLPIKGSIRSARHLIMLACNKGYGRKSYLSYEMAYITKSEYEQLKHVYPAKKIA